MKKTALCVLAVLAAAVSTSAVAKDRKAPAVSATQMSNSEMDRVTAGDPGGNGGGPAWGTLGTPAWQNMGHPGPDPNGKAVGNPHL